MYSSDAAKQRRNELSKAWETAKRLRWKLTVLLAYGGRCKCCGEDELAFLTLEHKNHDAKEHKKHDAKEHKKRTGGWNKHYRDIIRRNFPKEYTILCMNCNWVERNGGICPHKLTRKKHEDPISLPGNSQ